MVYVYIFFTFNVLIILMILLYMKRKFLGIDEGDLKKNVDEYLEENQIIMNIFTFCFAGVCASILPVLSDIILWI